jgi:protein CLEC16A
MFARHQQMIIETEVVNHGGAENRFSLSHLRKLHQQLVANKEINESNKNLVVEILRILAEMVVYGDNKSELLFDFFCEKNMLSLFLELMWTEGGCPSIVHIQILQTLSILINCVKNDTSLYYLLSNNYINEIIIYPHNFESDESLCDQFVSFMKSVSLKLNVQTVQFFFIEETGSFPILTKAIELLGFQEQMVRIAAQSTILNIYRVDDIRAREYALQDDVLHELLCQMVKIMKKEFAIMVKYCKEYSKVSNDENKSLKIENYLEDLLTSSDDWFYYLQDLLDLKVVKLKENLIKQLLHGFIYPILLNPFKSSFDRFSIKAINKDFAVTTLIGSVNSNSDDGIQMLAINGLLLILLLLLLICLFYILF